MASFSGDGRFRGVGGEEALEKRLWAETRRGWLREGRGSMDIVDGWWSTRYDDRMLVSKLNLWQEVSTTKKSNHMDIVASRC